MKRTDPERDDYDQRLRAWAIEQAIAAQAPDVITAAKLMVEYVQTGQ